MKKNGFNVIDLIAKAFEEKNVKYRVVTGEEFEIVEVDYPVDFGPKVTMRFIATDDDNDIAARIFGLLTGVPIEKRHRVLQSCNLMNTMNRHTKFLITDDGEVNVEYDFAVSTSDDCVGEIAFEILVRFMRILDEGYELFIKAIFTQEEIKVCNDYLPDELIDVDVVGSSLPN